MSTVYALSTPPGRSGVAVVRVSGPLAGSGLKALIKNNILPRRAVLATLADPDSGEKLDQALVLFFEGPASYTGEDVAEYHIHGGRATIEGLLDTLSKMPGYRMAEPGEFTRRAFENGKMDLTEAEAIADLIDAETQLQRNQALAQMGGALSDLYNRWTQSLKTDLAHLEADIEFPDEDMPEGIAPEIRPRLKALITEISAHLQDNNRGERLRDGIQIAVIGAPNAGKSSLVNALAQRDVAIVSEVKGTTRDVIETHLDLGGYPVILSDTAGLRPDQIRQSDQDQIESEGIRRAMQRAEEADLKLLLFDGTQDTPDPHTLALLDGKSLPVINKADQDLKLSMDEAAQHISAKTGEGLEALLQEIVMRIQNLVGFSEAPSLTRKRHRRALEACVEALERTVSADMPELMAEDMRLAMREIGRITGKVDVEDLLDVVFRDFCIGK